ncbi:galactokinase [Kocuria koreensis]|jgi:galactokinase|uniref:Galactokinase n=1 Tax=Rothia koreensis TaxID=592378 RepID=A0A7K1LJA8_9MICC|nr:galactokinase [Rothia koreensis]MUN55269.1 galactokinase [Rothia koreensis]
MTEPVWKPAPNAREQIDAARSLFRETYGSEPWAVFSAPGRVNLIGEHVDYNGGTVVPLALPHRTYVAVAPREDRRVRVASAEEPGDPVITNPDDVAPGRVHGWTSYVFGVPWAMAHESLGSGANGVEIPGADLAICSSVPLGAGLSSSAALECSVAVAFDALASREDADRPLLASSDEGRARLATACILAENEIAGASTGGMDQSISLRAQEGSVLTIDCRDFSSRPLQIDVASAGLSLLVIDTRAPHRLVDGQYAKRREGCDSAARALDVPTLRDALDEAPTEDDVQRLLREWDAAVESGAQDIPAGHTEASMRGLVRHVWTEVLRTQKCVGLFSDAEPPAGDPAWASLGEILNGSHDSLRDDYRVSSPELDAAVDAARAAGALGARMTGGGFGGSAIALVRREHMEAVASAVADAFADAGFGPPEFLEALPSGAARRDV